MFVYIVVAKPYMKIGISRNVQQRVAQVQTGCPVKISRVLYFDVGSTSSAEKIEKLLHQRYAASNTWESGTLTTMLKYIPTKQLSLTVTAENH